jgi:ATP synthase protein I
MENHNDLKTRLKIAKTKNISRNPDKNVNSSSMGSAFKLSTDLVAHVAVGTIIGFILDSWFDTKPWLIIIFFFLGSIAGILNVIKTAKQMQEKE